MGVCNDRRPFAVLGREKRREFLGRAGTWFNAELCKPGLNLPRPYAFVDGRIEPRHHGSGSTGGRYHAFKARHHEGRDPAFDHWGEVGNGRKAGWRGHGEGGGLALLCPGKYPRYWSATQPHLAAAKR